MVLTHRYILPNTEQWSLFHSVLENCFTPTVLPLVDTSINPTYLVTALVVLNENKPVGALVVYYNPYLSNVLNETWLIGNYACIDDNTVASYLLNEAFTFIRSKGGKRVIGPLNGSTWDDYRFRMPTENPMFFSERYAHTYSIHHFTNAGFCVLGEYFSGIDSLMWHKKPEIMQRKIELEKMDVVFRNIDLASFESELNLLYPFLNTAFSTNYLYSPILQNDFTAKHEKIKPYIDAQYVFLAEQHNEIVGVFFCVPNYLDTTKKGLVIKTIARKNNPELKGLGHVMAELLYEKAHQNNIAYLIHAFMYKQGTSVSISKNYNGTPAYTYCLYEKTL